MKIKDLAKIYPVVSRRGGTTTGVERQKIAKRMAKICVCCGKAVKVILYKDKTYRGGHYFVKLIPNAEYWECPKCYWGIK